jgi:GNAT superfamily N-acetyltransferase
VKRCTLVVHKKSSKEAMGMAVIRAATAADNAGLVSLLTRNPQGTNLVVRLDRAPDFFARSQPYEQFRTYVAEDNGEIVGAAETALKRVRLGGEEILCAYHYSLAVDKAYRRAGLALKLERTLQEFDWANGAKFCYVWILEDNIPSLKLTRKEGFEDIVRFDVHVFLPFRKQSVPPGVRPATPDDYPALAAMLNGCYREYDFYAPFTAESLAAYITRLPGFAPADLYIAEKNGEIVGCLGCWDYSRVIQGSIIQLSSQLKMIARVFSWLRPFFAVPRVPEIGKTWAYCVAVPIGYKYSPADLLPLWRHFNNFAVERGANVIMLPLDPGSEMKKLTKTGLNIKVGLHSLAKTYGDFVLPRGRVVFADPCDI